jgi:hypothetical protein
MILSLALFACSPDFGLASVEAPEEGAEADERPTESAEESEPIEEGGDTGEPASETETEPEPEEEPAEDPAPDDDCEDTEDLIYVLSRDDGQLYTFDPEARAFTALGRVSCGTSQTPGSMSVDRTGTAYVRYADNSVYALDLATMACAPTGYSDRASGFDSFGMGYATDSNDTWRDQLYVANEDQLGVLDTGTWTIQNVGRMASQSELTGNSDGELWAFLPLEQPAEIVQLDLDSAAVLTTLRLPGFPDPGDIDTFAFATWGGAFYVFVREYGMGSSTDVYEVDGSGVMSKILVDVGFDVVGAGVSTCAPSE